MTTAAFPFQNIPHHHRGIDPVQQGQRFIGIQPHICDARHPAKAQISIQQFLRLITFTIGIIDPLPHSSGGAFALPNYIAMKVQKLPERERKYLDFHASSSQVGGILGGQKIRIGAGHIDVAVKIHPEGIYRILPLVDALDLVKKQVGTLFLRQPLLHIPVQFLCGHSAEVHGFKIHLDDLIIAYSVLTQMKDHKFHQTGFSTAPDACDDLDRLGILKRDQSIQIKITAAQFTSVFQHRITSGWSVA